ncbi:MAG: hypothetical protein AB8H47_16500 [Bacteroidia bacterium]
MALKKRQKWLLGAVIGIVLLILLGQLLIDRLVVPMVERGVREYVKRQSQGLYQINELEAHWDLVHRQLTIENLSLDPDSVELQRLIDAGLAPRRWYSLHVPRIELDLFNFREAFFARRIFLGAARIYEPQLTIRSRIKTNEVRPNKLYGQSLYPLIQENLDALYIQEVMITQGNISYNDPEQFLQHAFQVRGLSVAISDFRIDSAHTVAINQPFYAKTFSLEVDIDDYSYVLPDSSYQIQVGKLGFSTQNSQIYLDNLSLHPNFARYQRLKAQGEAPPNQFEIRLPRLQLSDLDLPRALFQQELQAGALRIIQPNIFQLGPRQDASQFDIEQYNGDWLYQQISPLFSSVSIDGVTVERGNFRRLRELGDTASVFSMRGIGLYLSDLQIDSSQIGQFGRLRVIKEIEAKADNYLFAIRNGDYQLRGTDLRFSTEANIFRGGEIDLLATATTRARYLAQGRDIIGFNVPGIAIDGLDLSEAWDRRVLDVDMIRLESPEIRLTNPPEIRQAQLDSLAETDLYTFIAPFLDTLRVRDLQVEQGSFFFNSRLANASNSLQAPDFSLQVNNFLLAPGGKAKRFYADDIALDLNIDQYSLMLPDSSYALTIERLGLSVADSAIFIDSLRLTPVLGPRSGTENSDKNQHTADIFVPRLYLNGFDVYQAYFEERLYIDSVGISHPEILISSQIRKKQKLQLPDLDSLDLYSMLKPYFRSLNIGALTLDSTHLQRISSEGDSIQKLDFPNLHLAARGLSLDSTSQMGPDNLLFTQELSVRLQDWQYDLPDSIHTIALSELSYNTDKKAIQILDIELIPRDTSQSQTYYAGKIPGILIDGVDAYELYQEKILEVDRIQLTEPSVQMTRLPEVDIESFDSLAQTDLYELIAQQLNALRVKRFLVMDGDYRYRDQFSEEGDAFEAENILVLISNFEIDPQSRTQTDKPFYADNIEVSIQVKPYAFYAPDSSYLIQFDEIGLSTADSSIILENVVLDPQMDHPKMQQAPNVFELFLPKITLRGLDAKSIYFDRKMLLSNLLVEKPRIKWTVQSEAAGRVGNWDVQKALKPIVDELEVKNFNITGGTLYQSLPIGDTRIPLDVPSFSATAKGFRLDSMALLRPDRQFYSDRLKVSIGAFSRPIMDSLYSLQWKKAEYFSASQQLIIDSMEMVPNFDTYDYVIQHGYRKGWIHAQTHRVEVDSVNLYECIDQERFHIPRVYVGGLDIYTRADRRFKRSPEAKASPPELIRKMAQSLQIDSIWVIGGMIRYHEYAPTGREGELYLDELHGLVTGFTNRPGQLESPNMTMQIDANLMGQGLIEAQVVYPLTDSANAFTVRGSVQGLDLTSLNSFLEPAANLKVNRGQAQKLEFNMRGNDRYCRGRMRFWYEDLNVSLFGEKKNQLQPTLIRRFWASFFANTVVRSHNPQKRFLRIGSIEYIPEDDRSFVSNWVQALLTGLKSSVGISNKEEKDKLLGTKWQDDQLD